MILLPRYEDGKEYVEELSLKLLEVLAKRNDAVEGRVERAHGWHVRLSNRQPKASSRFCKIAP